MMAYVLIVLQRHYTTMILPRKLKRQTKLSKGIPANVFGLCVVALSRNLKLTTTLDRAITQNPCYVPLNLEL